VLCGVPVSSTRRALVCLVWFGVWRRGSSWLVAFALVSLRPIFWRSAGQNSKEGQGTHGREEAGSGAC